MIIIIMHHIGQYLYQDCANYSCLPSYPLIIQQLGYTGTGIFFFLSGYGMIHSVRRRKIDVHYVSSKFYKLFIPYFLTRFYLIVQNFISGNDINIIPLFIWIISIQRCWFLTVIITVYAIVFITFIFSHNEKRNLIILSIASLAWIPIAYFELGLAKWWYNSILCFPFGMLCAIYLPLIEKYKNLILSLTVAICILCYILNLFIVHSHYIGFEIVIALCISFISVYIFSKINANSRIIGFIGDKSLYFYCLQGGIISFIAVTHNFILLTAITIPIIYVLTYLLSWVGDKGYTLIFDKQKK